jgi:hypothetical protein
VTIARSQSSRGPVCADELRAALTTAVGTELARVVVREAILGAALEAEPRSLRARLRAAANEFARDGAPRLSRAAAIWRPSPLRRTGRERSGR